MMETMAAQRTETTPRRHRDPRVSVGGLLRPTLTSLLCLGLGAPIYLVGFGLTLDDVGEAGLNALTGFLLADLVLGVAACIAVGPLRRSLWGNVLIICCGMVSSFALPAWLVATKRLGQRRMLALDLAVVAAMMLGVWGMYAWQDSVSAPYQSEVPLPSIVTAAVAGLITGCGLLWGRVRGTRAALIASLREQARTAELARVEQARTREAEKRQARFDERRSVARDMHDGVSHQLSIIAMHAGALASRDDLAPAQIREASHVIHQAARDAGSMLADILTALREPVDAENAGQQHLQTLRTLRSVLDSAASRGTNIVVVRQELSTAEWERNPARTASLLRMLDEALVNAGKHAPGEPVHLDLQRLDAAVVLRVRNRLPDDVVETALGTGNGLLGIEEQAMLLGGKARSGPTADDHFSVEVELPWT